VKEKNKNLSQNIFWLEPDNGHFEDLKMRMLTNPNSPSDFFLNFPDPKETLIGLNLFFSVKQTKPAKVENVKKLALNYMT
jgi:hypothetical protein